MVVVNGKNRSIFASGRDSIHEQFSFNVSGEYKLLIRLSSPKDGVGSWLLECFIQSSLDPSLLYPLDKLAALSQVIRLAAFQQIAAAHSVSEFVEINQENWPIALSSESAFEFIKVHAFRLRNAGFVVQIPKNLEQSARAPIRLNFMLKNLLIAGRSDESKLLEFDVTLSVGDVELSEEQLAEIARFKSHLVLVKNKWVEVNPVDAVRALDFISKNSCGKSVGELFSSSVSAAGDGFETAFFSSGKRFQSITDAICGSEKFNSAQTPESFTGVLRPYQKRGVGWLGFLGSLGLGALLADDMGLGKTVQVIAYVLGELKNPCGPFLIICPTSVIGNWVCEFARFAPSLRVTVHYGAERNEAETFARQAGASDVVITSYSLSWRDVDELASVSWFLAVLDEAQNIKNPFSKQAQCVKRIKARHRVALTGTPVENRLSDLWSIMDFLNPGYLYSWVEFKERFVKPIEVDGDAEKKTALRGALSSIILRRVKTDKTIINDLPEKIEVNERCYLTSEQASLYKAIVDSSLEKIEGAEEESKKRFEVFAAITKLKQVCNHPSNFLKDSLELGQRSGKVERLREMLFEMIENGESCLIFSQYTEMGALLHHNFKKEFASAQFFFFHGALSRKKRDDLVKEFSAQNEKPKIMILSLKAGGTGLNLTQASNVIHFDRWWNPAAEKQATDRAFRIGQNKNVFVYKFITLGTIEERIESILYKKQGLFDSVIGSGEAVLTSLNGVKLRELFELRET